LYVLSLHKLVDGVVPTCTQNKCERCKRFTYLGGDRKKIKTGTKEIEQFKKTCGFILYCELEAASLFNTWLVSGCEEKTIF